VVRGAAQSLGLRLQIVPVRGSIDYGQAFAAMVQENAGALIIAGSPTFIQDRRDIAALTTKHRLPSAWPLRDDAEAGGLIAYGASQSETIKLADGYVDKILKGARPGDLPIEQPTKFALVINLKTARALGLTIPQALLLRADEVIQ